MGSVCTKFEGYIVWAGHSDIGIARSQQQAAQRSVIAYLNNSKHFFILATKEIRLFHLRILLTLLNDLLYCLERNKNKTEFLR